MENEKLNHRILSMRSQADLSDPADTPNCAGSWGKKFRITIPLNATAINESESFAAFLFFWTDFWDSHCRPPAPSTLVSCIYLLTVHSAFRRLDVPLCSSPTKWGRGSCTTYTLATTDTLLDSTCCLGYTTRRKWGKLAHR